MVVEALELAVVQAVSELLVNEEREASRASRESIREDGSIVLLWRLEENPVFLVRFRRDLGVKRRDRGSENQFSDELEQVQNFALELPSVESFVWPLTSWARSSQVA